MIIKGHDETFDTDMIVKLGTGSELIKDNRVNGILVVNQHGQSFGLGSYPNKQQLEDVFAALSEMFIDSDTKIFTMPKPIKNER